ncbi:MAG: GGDEF domain-containing protein [Alphaproteobacteria bacterium]|nr:GGDEF domain-containing protein [Alphaproteobacteria bacterium]
MKLYLKAAQRGQITTEAPSLVEQIVTFAAVKTFEAAKTAMVLLSETPKKINEKIISTLNSDLANGAAINPESKDELTQSILDNLHMPAVITRLSDAKILYFNNKAQKKFCISDICAIKLSDLYVNKDDYKMIVKTISKHKKINDFETSLRSLAGKEIQVSGSSNMVWYKGQRCKITSFQDITAEKEYKNMALTDDMTGIHNRRSLVRKGKAEFTRSRRYKHAMSVLMLDVDHFKKVNDTYGHIAGDNALIALTETVSKALRCGDVFGRLGGEEFAIILPETDLKAAEEIAERIRMEIKEISVKTTEKDTDFGFTTSIGVTTLSHKDADVEDTLNRADVALYEAKNNGRDKVIVRR